MQKNTLLILMLSVAFHFSNAQSSVSIGSNTPNPKAVLWLNAQGGQGFLLPSLTTSARTGMGLNNSTEKGMLVYDNQLDRIFFWNGSTWVEAVGGGEVDGIIGNEVSQVTTDRGLVLSGSGTAASPLSVGLMDGTADQQVLKWNNTTKKWDLGTDVGSAFIAGAGIQISGTTIINSGDTDATNDITTTSVAAGDVTGLFSNLQIGPTTVTTAELANNAVTTLKIADDAVTLAKIGTAGVTDALKVMTTDASGNPQWSAATVSGDMFKATYDANANNVVDAAETINYPSQTANSVLAAPNGSAGTPSFRALTTTDVSSGVFPVTRGGTGISTVVPGAVAYGGTTDFAFTSAGTAGQLLQSNGAGVPSWVTTKYIGTTSGANITITSTSNVQLLAITVPESGSVDAHITANLTVEISGNGLGRYTFSIRQGSINGPQIGQTGWWRPGASTAYQAVTITVGGVDNSASGPLTYYLVGTKFDASAQDALVFLTGIEMHYTVK